MSKRSIRKRRHRRCATYAWRDIVITFGGVRVEGLKRFSFRDPVSGFELESAK